MIFQGNRMEKLRYSRHLTENLLLDKIRIQDYVVKIDEF